MFCKRFFVWLWKQCPVKCESGCDKAKTGLGLQAILFDADLKHEFPFFGSFQRFQHTGGDVGKVASCGRGVTVAWSPDGTQKALRDLTRAHADMKHWGEAFGE